jgi:hypothetical protein
MKKLLVLQETNFYGEPRIRGIFSTPQLAYDYITDYLNYLEIDAKEVFGGKRLEMELLRLSIIRERLPEILNWNLSDKKYFHFFSEGIELNSIECYEGKDDLPANQKEHNCPIIF